MTSPFHQTVVRLFVKLAKLEAHHGVDTGYANRGGIATSSVAYTSIQ